PPSRKTSGEVSSADGGAGFSGLEVGVAGAEVPEPGLAVGCVALGFAPGRKSPSGPSRISVITPPSTTVAATTSNRAPLPPARRGEVVRGNGADGAGAYPATGGAYSGGTGT